MSQDTIVALSMSGPRRGRDRRMTSTLLICTWIQSKIRSWSNLSYQLKIPKRWRLSENRRGTAAPCSNFANASQSRKVKWDRLYRLCTRPCKLKNSPICTTVICTLSMISLTAREKHEIIQRLMRSRSSGLSNNWNQSNSRTRYNSWSNWRNQSTSSTISIKWSKTSPKSKRVLTWSSFSRGIQFRLAGMAI